MKRHSYLVLVLRDLNVADGLKIALWVDVQIDRSSKQSTPQEVSLLTCTADLLADMHFASILRRSLRAGLSIGFGNAGGRIESPSGGVLCVVPCPPPHLEGHLTQNPLRLYLELQLGLHELVRRSHHLEQDGSQAQGTKAHKTGQHHSYKLSHHSPAREYHQNSLV